VSQPLTTGVTQETEPQSSDPRFSVRGDPFVVDKNGNKVQFFMPLKAEKHLLSCESWALYGSAFGTGITGDHQQWFDSFRLAYEQNNNELEIRIANNETSIGDDADIAAPQDTSKDLKVLEVKMGGVKVSKTGAVASENACLAAIWKTAQSETVQFSCNQMVLQIKSSLAQKFDEAQKQKLYTHLDLRFIELPTSSCTGGILAEIWGFTPMTQTTARMLEAPQNK